MMSILFMIGSGREPLELCESLLSVIDEQTNGPIVHYEIASEIPLVLYECFYEKEGEERIEWISGSTADKTFIEHNEAHFHGMWELKQAESCIYRGVLKSNYSESPARSTGSLFKMLNEFKCD